MKSPDSPGEWEANRGASGKELRVMRVSTPSIAPDSRIVKEILILIYGGLKFRSDRR